MNRKSVLVGAGLFLLTLVVGIGAGAAFGGDESAAPDPAPTTTTSEATDEIAVPALPPVPVDLVEPLYVGAPLDDADIASITGSQEPSPEEQAAAAAASPDPDGTDLGDRVDSIPEPRISGTSTEPATPQIPDDLPDPSATCADDDPVCSEALDRLAEDVDTLTPDDRRIDERCALADAPDECAAYYEELLERIGVDPEVGGGDQAPPQFVDGCLIEELGGPEDAADPSPDTAPETTPEDPAQIEEGQIEEGQIEDLLAGLDRGSCSGVGGTIELLGGASIDVLAPILTADHHPICVDPPEITDDQSSILFATSAPAVIAGTVQPIGLDGEPDGDLVDIEGETTMDEPVVLPDEIAGGTGDGTTPYWVTCVPLDPGPDTTLRWSLEARVAGEGAIPRSIRAQLPVPIGTLEGGGGGDGGLVPFYATDLERALAELAATERRVLVSPNGQRALHVDVDADDDERVEVTFKVRSDGAPSSSRCAERTVNSEGPYVARSSSIPPVGLFDGVVRASPEDYVSEPGDLADVCVEVYTDTAPRRLIERYEVPVAIPDPPIYEVAVAGPFTGGGSVPDSLRIRTVGDGSGCTETVESTGEEPSSDTFLPLCDFGSISGTFTIGVSATWPSGLTEPRTSRLEFAGDSCPSLSEPCDQLAMVYFDGPDPGPRPVSPGGTVLVRIRRLAHDGPVGWSIGSPEPTLDEPEDDGPVIDVDDLSVVLDPDDPSGQILVEGKADRPVDAAVRAYWVDTLLASEPCGGWYSPPSVRNEDDPTRFVATLPNLCPGNTYRIVISLTDDEGRRTHIGGDSSRTDSSLGNKGRVTTEPLRVPVKITFDWIDRGFDGLLIPYDFGVLAFSQASFGIPISRAEIAYSQPYPDRARGGLDCAAPDFFDREIVTELELGSPAFSVHAKTRTWTHGCPSAFDHWRGTRYFGESYEDEASLFMTSGEFIEALDEGGIEIYLDRPNLSLNPTGRLDRDNFYVFAAIRIEHAVNQADATVAVAEG
ncbi:MAG: hypothetical protein OSA99_02500 [Acidimicrobiales bacterium]|nr:hypothetical protein [Acidimicrobiales bacterium]